MNFSSLHLEPSTKIAESWRLVAMFIVHLYKDFCVVLFFVQLYIKYSYVIQIICTQCMVSSIPLVIFCKQVYGFKYFYLIIIIS